MNLKYLIINNKLIKSFGIYTFAKVINSCIPLFMLPIMTKYLSPADYGIISMITTFAAFVLPFVSVNTDSAIVRKYYDKNENILDYIGTCVSIVIVMCVVFTLIVSVFANDISRLTQIPNYILYFVPLYCVFTFFKTIVLYSWQVNGEPIKYGLFSIILTAIEIGIALFSIICLGLNWQGRAFSLFTTALLATLFAVIYLRKQQMIRICYNKENAYHAIKYGSGLIPHAIGVSLMVLANRFFITNMVSINETGLYGVATQLASLISFITLSFNNAYVPWLFEKLSLGSDVENKRVVRITYLYYFALAIVIVIAFLLILLIYPLFVNDNFNGSIKYIPLLLIGNAFQGCYFMVTNYIMYSEKTYLNGLITLVITVISLLANYIFIKMLGGIGAAVAYATTYFLYFVITWIVSMKVCKMPWFNILKK
ncbi:lipopolysaccharide biosynthesis protein [Butyricimonas muris]|uniref:lipopolysaccharide biosynthesis protein n=1 Tax=Butyricimonas muris TaxID=3378067 RepID=UPI00396733B6